MTPNCSISLNHILNSHLSKPKLFLTLIWLNESLFPPHDFLFPISQSHFLVALLALTESAILVFFASIFTRHQNDTFAEKLADVIKWAGTRMVPVHKDYAVTMYSQNGSSQIERVNLSIKLQRLPAGYTIYSDVILNGIEIFKIIDKNNLAGQISKFIELSPPHQEFSTQSSKNLRSPQLLLLLLQFPALCLQLLRVSLFFG